MSAPHRLFTPGFFVMCGFSFTVFLSVFQLLPTAPFHIHDLGGSTFASGLFLGFLTYSSAFSAPLTGAVVDRVKIVGNPMPNVFTLVGTEVAYFDRGAIRSAYTGWAMLHSDGTLAVRIRGHVTGGSGAYRRARGSYVFTGATPAGSDVTSGGSKGTITY